MSEIIIRRINSEELTTKLFGKFNRYQEVKKCWRKREGKWVLEDVPFIEQWTEDEYEFLVKCLINTVETKGAVLGAFENEALIGFASVENSFFGSKNQYLQLSSIHISYESRGKGIGKSLFKEISKIAKEMGAEKLYISAHSAEESQAFYKSMGCIEANEYNKQLTEEEPCDCQLEFSLK